MPQNLDANDLVSTTSDETNLDEDFDLRGEDAVEGDEGNGARSSDAHGEAGDERDTLDVVRDVVGERKSTEGSTTQAEKEGTDADPKGNQSAKERDDENFTDVPFHKHPRFQQLLAREKSNREDATRYRNVQGFLDQHGVNAEAAANALQIVALANTNPVKAWEMLKPMVQQLLVDAGEVLPQDLRARVDAGELTVDAANSIAKERARAVSAERAMETEQQRQERTRHQEHSRSIHQAAMDWEADRRAKDPNFEAKQAALMKEVAWLHQTEGKADTPAKVRDQLERAYKALPAMPQKRVVKAPTVGDALRQRPAASGGASQRTQKSQQPAGALKFIKQVVSQRGAA